MMKYRIVSRNKYPDGQPSYSLYYYAQMNVFGIWVDCNTDGGYAGFLSYEEANKSLCDAIEEPKVEYLDVSCEDN